MNLVHYSERDLISGSEGMEDLYEKIYWKKGAVDSNTGEKTLTLKQFEYRYTPRFMRIAQEVKNNTIYQKFLDLPVIERAVFCF